MKSNDLRDRWLAAIQGCSDDIREVLSEHLSRFAALFDTPDRLTKDALFPVVGLLNIHGMTALRDDVYLAFADASTDALARGWAMVNLADSKIASDDYQQAADLLQAARTIFTDLDDQEGLAKTLIHLGEIGRFANPLSLMDFDAAIVSVGRHYGIDIGGDPVTFYKQALSLTRKDFRRQRALLGLADIYLTKLQYDEAIEACRQAIDIQVPHADIAIRRWTITALLHVAVSLQVSRPGRPAAAKEIATACRQLLDTYDVGENWNRDFHKHITDILSQPDE